MLSGCVWLFGVQRRNDLWRLQVRDPLDATMNLQLANLKRTR